MTTEQATEDEEFTHGRIGGTKVHVFLQGSQMCGSGYTSSTQRLRYELTNEPVTCKKCLSFLEAYEKSRALLT